MILNLPELLTSYLKSVMPIILPTYLYSVSVSNEVHIFLFVLCSLFPIPCSLKPTNAGTSRFLGIAISLFLA